MGIDMRHGGKMWKLNAGNAWNPLKRFPRNHPCFCGSGIKHKKCCAPFVGEYTSIPAANTIDRDWNELMAGTKTINIRPSNA